MSKIDSAYAYYLMTYGNKAVSRYDSHKKSELRNVYNRMVKANTDAPLFKLTNPEDAKVYAIDIKESAKSIQNVVASLSDTADSSIESAFLKKVAVSSDEDCVSASYVGEGSEDETADHFQISVKALASPQINTGNYIESHAFSIMPGSYSFDLDTLGGTYEFQYNVNLKETNLDVQTKLANLFNSSGLGLRAELLTDEDGRSALQLTSTQTGLTSGEEQLFKITPSANSESIHAMEVLGLNQISSPASNSSFILNGTPQSSLSNTFTINNTFELTLKKPSNGESVEIGCKPNVDAVAHNIGSLIDAYNVMLSMAQKRDGMQPNNRLFLDISSISLNQKSALDAVGVMVGEHGELSIDQETLGEAITPEHADDTFTLLSNLKDAMGNKAQHASIDPMNYVDKIIVTYKNPGHNFVTPYITSIYAGMMLDSYA